MGLRDRLRRGFSEPLRPEPPKGAANYILLILDSCRFAVPLESHAWLTRELQGQ